MTPVKERDHEYAARLIWTGNTGNGTASYTSYERRFQVAIDGKPDLPGSADPAFRGEADRHNPEDLFLTAIAACHMLSYLALCARRGVRVLAYEDEVRGRMTVQPHGGGRFEEVTLHPRVSIDGPEDERLAMQLHDTAHEQCFIASSCRVAIRHEARVVLARPARESTP